MPMETPEEISSRAPPSNFASGRFFCLASASQMALSTAALAMLCPRTGARRSKTSEAALSSPPFSIGHSKSRMMWRAASTRRIRRSEVLPKLVSKGAISGIWISRRVILRRRIFGLGPLVFEFFRAIFWQTQPGYGSGRFQNVVGGCAAGLKASGDVSLMKQLLELVAGPGLHAGRCCAVFRFDVVESGGQRDGLEVSRCRKRIIRQNVFHAIGINPPFGNEPVGGQARVQRTFGDAVAVRDESLGDGAEADEIKVRVFQFQRIKGPFDQADVALQGILALKKLQAAADALVLVRRQHGGHVRMQERFTAARADQG